MRQCFGDSPPGVLCGAASRAVEKLLGAQLGGGVIADGRPGVPDGSAAPWPRKPSWVPEAVVYAEVPHGDTGAIREG